MPNITKFDDIIDSRDVIDRIEELEQTIQDEADNLSDFRKSEARALALTDDESEELDALRKLANEAEGSPDWQHGETLIRDSYFQEYAQELAEDCGMIPKDNAWPCTCIDWERAARELQMDYFSVEFDGIDYWIRS